MESILRRHETATAIGSKPNGDSVEVSLYYEPSATESEYAQLRSYLQSHGVEVTTESPLRHHLSLRASVEALNALLGIGLTEFVDSELGNFFAPDQEPVLPPALSIVTAILGLDSAVQARPRFRPATKPALSY